MTGNRIDPLALKFREPRYFEDFELGERFYLPSRTMTEGVFSAFQAASKLHAAAGEAKGRFPNSLRLETGQS